MSSLVIVKLPYPKLVVLRRSYIASLSGNLKTVTVIKTKTGEDNASLLFEDDTPKPTISSNGKAVGVDLGILDFAVTSKGSKYANPMHLKKHFGNLLRKHKKLSRKKIGSKHREKARYLVARVHRRTANTRKDFVYKLSCKLVNENQVLALASLNVRMVKNHNLAKAISNCWSNFVGMLKYKCELEGKVVVEVNGFFPSSKTCSNRLYQVERMPLGI